MKKLILILFVFLIFPGGQLACESKPPRVALETSMGTIVMELYADKAPKTVENFLAYVKDGHYDGTIFHRVIPKFMIQGGGFTTDMKRKSTRPPVQNEADNGLSNLRGTVSMARTNDPHSATCQFFINVVDNKYLDFKEKKKQKWGYTVFGHVVEGMDVVDAIQWATPESKGRQSSVPKEPAVIKKAKIL